MKTIRMPKKLLAKWLKALRSGEYKQAKGALYNPKTCGFCCLGVLQHVASGGSVEFGEFGDDKPNSLPSPEWLEENGIEFFSDGSWGDTVPGLFFRGRMRLASKLNDNGMKFTRLADLIEQHAEGV